MMQANEQETFLGLVAVSKEDHTTYTIIAGRTLRRHGHGLGEATRMHPLHPSSLATALSRQDPQRHPTTHRAPIYRLPVVWMHRPFRLSPLALLLPNARSTGKSRPGKQAIMIRLSRLSVPAAHRRPHRALPLGPVFLLPPSLRLPTPIGARPVPA